MERSTRPVYRMDVVSCFVYKGEVFSFSMREKKRWGETLTICWRGALS
jgi:hypothetical protein